MSRKTSIVSSFGSNVQLMFTLIVTGGVIIIRPRRSRSAASYSDQTFPWTICRSVRASDGPVHCEKNGGSDPDAVWHHRSDGPGMKQVAGFGDRSTERVLLGANLERAVVTNGDLLSRRRGPRSSQITLGRLVGNLASAVD